MSARAFSFGIIGLDAHPVTIEVDTGRGLPSMTIVGLPDNAIRESRERVRAALRNSGFDFPNGRITVNLAPADIKKEGPAFDLAIALGLLASSGHIPLPRLESFAVLGELSLGGELRPVSGALATAMGCGTGRFQGLVVPAGNADEAALAGNVPVFPFSDLAGTVQFLINGQNAPSYTTPPRAAAPLLQTAPDLSDVKGQTHAKRALEIAAAGSHNILLIGPPGGGKTMLARRFPGLLPPLNRMEQLDITRIRSSVSLTGLATERPFRAPHHTASRISLIGGGSHPRPGEVTLAHHGVLFLDELPEFSRATLECLRQPLEDGHVTVARASRTLSFPSRFTLLAAMNPCPCGHLGNVRRPCRCAATEIAQYRNRLSGPLLERIDIHVELPAVDVRELACGSTGETSAAVRERVCAARLLQENRAVKTAFVPNARLSAADIKERCGLDHQTRTLLNDAIERLGLSARSHDKILRVARTIADLDGKENIMAEHVAEAIGYRALDRAAC